MDKEVIEYGNKLIVLSGFGRDQDLKELQEAMAYDRTQGDNFNLNETNILSSLKYHTSWDWLHPVIEKIWDKAVKGEMPQEENREYAFLQLPIYTDIKTVWKEVVNFIKFYNQ